MIEQRLHLDKYIAKFASLHTDKNRKKWNSLTSHRAPHKMLLLLSVIELIDTGDISSNFIEVSPALLGSFDRYWHAIIPLGTRGNIMLPFFHMKSEGFWHLLPHPQKVIVANAMRRCDSFRLLNETFMGAKLEDDLFLLLVMPETRKKLREVLIETYFGDSLQIKLRETIVINHEAFNYSQTLFHLAKERSVAESTDEFKVRTVEQKVRDQGFRKAVVSAYNHRCSTCGIRMLTPQGHTVVDASHIIPWSESHNDDIRNGLSLCKLCHWAFDELLITITDGYEIKTSPVLKLNSNLPGHLIQMDGRKMITPEDESFYPGEEFLSHHQKRFRTAL